MFRAVAAAALEEGLLDSLRSDRPPRTVVWVANHGTAEATTRRGQMARVSRRRKETKS